MTSEPIAVLCYGDSNTWGYDASTQGRFGRWERWPGVAQGLLGDAYHLIEEGLGGRTTMFDVPGEADRNGLGPLPMLLETHAPLDVVVIALGVNDIFLPGINASWAARGVATLVERVRASGAGRAGEEPAMLVVAPPPLGPLPAADETIAPNARAVSRTFGEAYRAIADELGVEALDLADVCEPTPDDGVHFELDSHRAIGTAVAERIRALTVR